MKKRYFYQFSGNIFIKAIDQDEAWKLVSGISLNDYLVDQDAFEIDEFHIAISPEKRKEQIGTDVHPIDHYDQYWKYKMKNRVYGQLFLDFLLGKFNRTELVEKIQQADETKKDEDDITYISMVDLETQERKLSQIVSVV